MKFSRLTFSCFLCILCFFVHMKKHLSESCLFAFFFACKKHLSESHSFAFYAFFSVYKKHLSESCLFAFYAIYAFCVYKIRGVKVVYLWFVRIKNIKVKFSCLTFLCFFVLFMHFMLFCAYEKTSEGKLLICFLCFFCGCKEYLSESRLFAFYVFMCL